MTELDHSLQHPDLLLLRKTHARLFPDHVVDHMVNISEVAPAGVDAGKAIPMQCTCHREQVRALPDPWDLQVVIAARLSLSVPSLISAVPLFCVDWARGPGNRTLIETWFQTGHCQ